MFAEGRSREGLTGQWPWGKEADITHIEWKHGHPSIPSLSVPQVLLLESEDCQGVSILLSLEFSVTHLPSTLEGSMRHQP